jgi:hypothetical protein
MTTKISKKALAYILLAATLVAIAIRAVNLICFYDAALGYYVEGAALPTVMNVIFLLFALYLGFVAFAAKRSDFSAPDTNESPAYVKSASVLAALLPVVMSLSMLLSEQDSLVYVGLVLSAFVGAVYFLSSLSKKEYALAPLAAVGIIAWLLIVVAVSYFDWFTPMISPGKILLHVAAISSALYFVTEAQLKNGAPLGAKYIVTLYASVFCCGALSVPSMIASLAFGINRAFLEYDVVFLGLFIYFLAKLFELTYYSPAPVEATLEAEEENEAASENE